MNIQESDFINIFYNVFSIFFNNIIRYFYKFNSFELLIKLILMRLREYKLRRVIYINLYLHPPLRELKSTWKYAFASFKLKV